MNRHTNTKKLTTKKQTGLWKDYYHSFMMRMNFAHRRQLNVSFGPNQRRLLFHQSAQGPDVGIGGGSIDVA